LTFANITSLLALFVALGGVAYATTQLPPGSVGTAQLKKDAVTSPKIKDHTTAGVDINKSKLGKVPLATNATRLGGKLPNAYLPASSVQTIPLRTFSVGETGRQILTRGPFTVTLDCTGGGSPAVTVQAASSEAGSTLGDNPSVAANTPVPIQQIGGGASPSSSGEESTLLAPSGARVYIAALLGTLGFGRDCYMTAKVLA
jgi:hypothetical protein